MIYRLRWVFVMCKHLFISVQLLWFEPPCYSSSRQLLRLLGAICPIWSSRAAGHRFCSFLRRCHWRSSRGCSPCIHLQLAGSTPPMGRSMFQWRWFGWGWWMGCRWLFGTWWVLCWYWRGWLCLWIRQFEVHARFILIFQSQFFRNETTKSVGVNIGVLGAPF